MGKKRFFMSFGSHSICIQHSMTSTLNPCNVFCSIALGDSIFLSTFIRNSSGLIINICTKRCAGAMARHISRLQAICIHNFCTTRAVLYYTVYSSGRQIFDMSSRWYHITTKAKKSTSRNAPDILWFTRLVMGKMIRRPYIPHRQS